MVRTGKSKLPRMTANQMPWNYCSRRIHYYSVKFIQNANCALAHFGKTHAGSVAKTSQNRGLGTSRKKGSAVSYKGNYAGGLPLQEDTPLTTFGSGNIRTDEKWPLIKSVARWPGTRSK